MRSHGQPTAAGSCGGACTCAGAGSTHSTRGPAPAMPEKGRLTEEDGYEALRGHVVDRARSARSRHAPALARGSVEELLADRDAVRFPTTLAFDAEPLLPGEFAWARPEGERPQDGFTLVVHPALADRADLLPLCVAYHVVSINYLDVATHEEAELFGATLLGLEVDEYYERLCVVSDSLSGGAGGE